MLARIMSVVTQLDTLYGQQEEGAAWACLAYFEVLQHRLYEPRLEVLAGYDCSAALLGPRIV